MPNLFLHRNLLVDFLSLMFGISSWIGITAIFLQLPFIVESAPEGWKLPSYIAIIVQAGNIASVVYIVYEKYSRVKCDDGILIYITLACGCIAAISLVFTYKNVVVINGVEHSLPLLILSGVFAMVGCLSSVLFMPYMGRLKEMYLISFMLGQGLNGFISSVISLIQGVSVEFDSSIFFYFLFVMLVLSTISFILLHNLPQCKREYVANVILDGNDYRYKRQEDDYEVIPEDIQHLSRSHYSYLMIILAIVACLGYGVLPGVQSYSCRPYGPTAYRLSATLSAFANPLSCFLSMWLPHPSFKNLTIQSVVTLLTAAYLLETAIQSPSPPFVDTTFGSVLIVRQFVLHLRLNGQFEKKKLIFL